MVYYASIGIKREKRIFRNNDSPPYVHIRFDISSLSDAKLFRKHVIYRAAN